MIVGIQAKSYTVVQKGKQKPFFIIKHTSDDFYHFYTEPAQV